MGIIIPQLDYTSTRKADMLSNLNVKNIHPLNAEKLQKSL